MELSGRASFRLKEEVEQFEFFCGLDMGGETCIIRYVQKCSLRRLETT